MKRILTLALLCFHFVTYAQESVVWGHEIMDVSSEFGALEYSALQALHKPNVLPAGGDNPNAWRPKNDNKKDFIMVAFENPIIAKQIAIAESENPGAITHISAYDEDYNEYTLLETTPRVLPIKSRLLNFTFEETGYKIVAVRVDIDGAAVPGYNAIDAIGISDSNIPIETLIQMTQGVAKKLDAEELGNSVNSTYVEHSPVISPDGKRLYFSRKYHPDNVGGVDDAEDIWYSEKDPKTGEWLPAVNAGPPLNTAGPNFISSITEVNGKQQLVLGNKYGKKGRMYAGTSFAYLDEGTGKFSNPVAVDIENDYNYSPKSDYFMVAGGKKMIMSVERDDSYGGRDLYVTTLSGKSWTEPISLGGGVNTAGVEASPFLADDGKTLYFSSNGYAGYGGLDIYVTRRLDDSWEKWSPPDNLGSGINTEGDDLYFSIPSNGQHVYFTRGNTDEDTDIFRFKVDDFFIDPDDPIVSSVSHLMPEEEEIIITVTVRGKVLDDGTGEPLPGAKVIVERLPDGVDIGEVEADEEGNYMFSLRPGARFGVSASREHYLAQDENLDLNEVEESDTIDMNLHLVPIEKGAPIVLNNIFFDFNKTELKTSSYPELERVLEFLVSGEIRKIEISGHTDSIGSESVNQSFSERRARAVFNYFRANGISPARMTVVGYGESKPVASNDTKEGQQRNRRVEFKVLETGN